MKSPVVSFVVPCYKLAHLLPDCVRSILSQTYGDLEVLIMDDCSPDDTAAVARSFNDPRVRHIRNEPNLGHLRNYNQGIGLARGQYVWLISADDYLRRPYLVQQYVACLEAHPQVGYAFCAGVGVRNGVETAVLEYATCGPEDRVMNGHRFLRRLLRGNCVLAASGLVRHRCYETLGAFPLDMPWAGDWYLWSLFALHYDVAYFAEPMVCYREHDLSMTTRLTEESILKCYLEDLAVPWSIKRKADDLGCRAVSRECLRALAHLYSRMLTCRHHRGALVHFSLEQFEQSLAQNTQDERELRYLRGWVHEQLGDEQLDRGEPAQAQQSYRVALAHAPWSAKVRAKKLLLATGPSGDYIRRLLRTMRSGNMVSP